MTEAPEQKVALVTGASRGIGAAIAAALSETCFVIGTATSEAGVQAISQALGDSGTGMVMRVDDDDSVSAFYAELADRDLKPLILVNNAGVTRDNLLMRMKDDEWAAVIDANLSSVFRLSKACLRGMMKARHGRIINIASVVAATGNPGQANYSAAKAGMIGFSKSLAREVGSRGITVNAIAPGFIDTDMTRNLAADQRESLISQIPLGRLGDVDDIASAAVFLASPQAAYITGETLHVNGGMHMD